MKYKVELTREAALYVRRLDRPTQDRIRRRLRELGGANTEEGRQVVIVLTIGPRGDVYRRL